jgi:Phytanoyl-CoA dioxygenase (PhyH)
MDLLPPTALPDPSVLPYLSGVNAGLLDTATLHADSEAFWRTGYFIVRGAFTADEMDITRRAITGNARMNARVESLRPRVQAGDRPAFETVFVWNDTGGDDVFAKLTRNYRLFDRLCHFFGDHIYVYHNKIALKYPGMPGFRHHQDYFYWYGMGNLLPDMATAQIAIDRSTRANGCLRILEGSHRLGRVDHMDYTGPADSGVEERRLAAIRARFPEVDIELEPGDAVLFHCNTLHASADNPSELSRIALLGCYNTRRNSPYEPNHSGHPLYAPQASITAPITAADEARLPDFDVRFNQP